MSKENEVKSQQQTQQHPEGPELLKLPPDFRLFEETREREKANKPPEVVHGFLRKGTCGVISAATKTGKTFLMSELAVAVATGGDFLKWACTQGNVFVIDFEMLKYELVERYEAICEAQELNIEEVAEHIYIKPMKGTITDSGSLVDAVIKAMSAYKENKIEFDLIIIDPIYTLLDGEESRSDVVERFSASMDSLATQTGCAVVYCHHHSKGSKGQTAAIDRMSGSGIFARGPHTVLDLIELVPTPEQFDALDDDDKKADGYARADVTYRSYKNTSNFDIFFTHPIHRVDDEKKLVLWEPASDARKNKKTSTGKSAGNTEHKKKEIRAEEAVFKIATMIDDNGGKPVLQSDVLKDCDVSKRTLQKYIDESEVLKRVPHKNYCEIQYKENYVKNPALF